MAVAIAAAALMSAGMPVLAKERKKPDAEVGELQDNTFTPSALEGLRNGTAAYQGRDYSGEFSAVIYATNYPGIAASLGQDPERLLEDYVKTGKSLGRRADRLLQQPYAVDGSAQCANFAYADLLYGWEEIYEVLDEVNKERVEEGVQELTLDPALTYYACVRAEELRTKFSHVRPDGTHGMEIVPRVEPECTAFAENIAMGQPDGTEAENDWIHSAGHRRNILNSKYTKIGIGISGKHYVQLFGN